LRFEISIETDQEIVNGVEKTHKPCVIVQHTLCYYLSEYFVA